MGRHKSTLSTEERFWSKVDIRGPDDCWEWLAGPRTTPYGRFWLDGYNYGSHVIAFQLGGGALETGKFVCHKCDNTRCCNPGHLFQDTPKGNTQDMIRKGRLNTKRSITENYQRGEGHSNSKLNWNLVREIRAKYQRGVRGYGVRQLVKEYGVTRFAIQCVLRHLTWKEE